jgi:hypothetical protein
LLRQISSHLRSNENLIIQQPSYFFKMALKIERKKIALFVLCLFSFMTGRSQGCSDAGVCTINSFKNNPDEPRLDSGKSQSITAGFFYGQGLRKTNVYTSFVEYNRKLNTHLSLSLKMTFAAINGELGNNTNLSDLFISAAYLINPVEKAKSSLVLGLKIPLNHANAQAGGNALPMVYQSSLGTYDLIAGYNLMYKSLGVSLGYQQPIFNANYNQFLPYSSDSRTMEYLSTNDYRRKADLLARITYHIPIIKHRFVVRPGLLPIYHLANDSYADSAGQRISIHGSQGLTLNGTADIDFNFSKNHSIELTAARPLIARKAIPDGLLRHILMGLTYRGKF